jgi:methionine aminopeptidase
VKCIYLFAGVLKQVIDKCVVGASVREICEFGDGLLVEETSKVFKKEKELKKGKPSV